MEMGDTSRGGAKYLFLITDDYSRKSWAFTLGRKSEVIDCFVPWLAQVQTETGETLAFWGTDGGGEFGSNAMEEILAKNGTVHEITPAYTSRRNSRSERLNLTTAEGIATVRVQSGLGPEWWAEIAYSFIHAKNLSPHGGIDFDVPETLWDPSRVPYVGHLRPIGCRGTMVRLKAQERIAKSGPKGRTVIMLGYVPTRKAYRVWDPVTDTIHEPSQHAM